VRRGFTQVHVSHLPEPVMSARLQSLHAVGEAGISIDFLKMTPSGMSFLVADSQSDPVESALKPIGVRCTVRPARCVVEVHAVNIRDEEGMIARIVAIAIQSGARLEHICDMHDRLLIVVQEQDLEPLHQELLKLAEAAK